MPKKRAETFNADGMMNLLTGLGDGERDRSLHSFFRGEPLLGASTLDAIYRDDGLAAKTVDLPADDMVREGVEFEGLEGVALDDVQSAIEDFGCLPAIADLHRWGDHYGGALLMACVDDGKPSYEPLELESVQAVKAFIVLDRHCVEPVMRGFAPPEGYVISSTVDTPFEDRVVHASRTIRYAGIEVAPRLRPSLMWWGVPLMQRVWSRFRQLASAYGYGEAILHDLSVDVFTIAGLADAFRAGKEDLIRKRLLALGRSKSILKAIALDAGGGADGKAGAETYVPQSRNASGIRELIELFLQAVTSVVRIPRSKLLGETVGGLNTGTNSGETREYYAAIGAEQRNKGTKWLNWMLEILFASRLGPTGGVRPSAWTNCWNPLWQPTDLEAADVRLKRLQGDQMLWAMGAASPADIRETRLERGAVGELIPIEEPTADVDVELPEGGVEGETGGEPKPIDEGASLGGAVGADGSVQAAVLNGAQIDGFIKLVAAVSEGTMPYETAARFLPIAFPGSIKNEAAARLLLADVERIKAEKAKAAADAEKAAARAMTSGAQPPGGGNDPAAR